MIVVCVFALLFTLLCALLLFATLLIFLLLIVATAAGVVVVGVVMLGCGVTVFCYDMFYCRIVAVAITNTIVIPGIVYMCGVVVVVVVVVVVPFAIVFIVTVVG